MNLLLIMAAHVVIEEEEEEAAHRRRKRKREDVDWWVRSTSEQQWIDGLSSPKLEGVEYESLFRVTEYVTYIFQISDAMSGVLV